ncbi:hypothetical protein BCR42DRAFT_407916 [Absidia repens]|uniref:RING-type domain-containing protein n=1 Tax=Absidia repens TaxID=90262 RepID=A0A1X2IUG4_9FUNG|nr:hypothetical protein BCR42DRAFT_407916 [Absidia repens]
MGQTPSTTSRQDNASTRTLHSSSMNSSRPRSFFRRLSRRLQTYPNRRLHTQPNRRFGLPRTLPPRQDTSVAPSVTSSIQHETMAATHATTAATGPLPPPPSLPFLNIDPHVSNSSAASTTSAISNSSEISQIISDLVTSAVLSSLSSSTQHDDGNSNNNNSTTSIQFYDSTSFFRYVQIPVQSPLQQQQQRQQQQQQEHHTASPTPLNDQQQRPSSPRTTTGRSQHQTMLPIVIVGYRTSSTDSPNSSSSSSSSTTSTTQSSPAAQTRTTSLHPSIPTHIPSRPRLHRPHSVVSTSSSLATLQSIPLSTHSNRMNPPLQATIQIQQQQQRIHRESLLSSSSASSASSTRSMSSSTAAVFGDRGRWLVYVMSGSQRQQQQQSSRHHPTFTRLLSDNPTYEDMLWLSNILGPARPMTTTQQAIDATLPIYSWSDETTKQTMLQDTERCLVCLDDFAPKHSVRVLKCRHVFHVECVDRWLVEAHNSCPVCRGAVVAPSSG